MVGLDPSPESANAAAVAWHIAQKANADLIFLHAVTDFWLTTGLVRIPVHTPELVGEITEGARRRIATALHEALPSEMEKPLGTALEEMRVDIGRPAKVLAAEAAQRGAALVVLGGKRHGAIARTLGGSTARDLLRIADVPVWVAGNRQWPIERVLVAVDLSDVSEPTLAFAERVAQLFGANLRALHVVEPLPPELHERSLASLRPYGLDERTLQEQCGAVFDRLLSGHEGVERALRSGPATETISAEAAEWRADLLVLGSHGRGWVDRILLGSTTERMLRLLPTSLLVVPVTRRG